MVNNYWLFVSRGLVQVELMKMTRVGYWYFQMVVLKKIRSVRKLMCHVSFFLGGFFRDSHSFFRHGIKLRALRGI